MNKKLALPIAAFLLLALGGMILAADLQVKAGDKVYVCSCGEKCDCGTVSNKAGKCGCGKDLVQATVEKAEAGSFTATVAGKARTFKTTGKYMCGCGETCDCAMVSDKPGKCSCGMDLVPAAH